MAKVDYWGSTRGCRSAFWNMHRRPVVQTVGIPRAATQGVEREGWVGCRGLLWEGGYRGFGGWAWGRSAGGMGGGFGKCGVGSDGATE
jgi:hypothetical protein